jgi:hypothetical protein
MNCSLEEVLARKASTGSGEWVDKMRDGHTSSTTEKEVLFCLRSSQLIFCSGTSITWAEIFIPQITDIQVSSNLIVRI